MRDKFINYSIEKGKRTRNVEGICVGANIDSNVLTTVYIETRLSVFDTKGKYPNRPIDMFAKYSLRCAMFAHSNRTRIRSRPPISTQNTNVKLGIEKA